MKRTFRTFVAVETAQPIRKRAAELIRLLQQPSADVKWVETQNLHLTMNFLGDVDEREIAAVCRAVGQAAEGITTFELEVRGAGAFPNPARPRTVWLGAGDGAQPMATLHTALEAALAKLGYREEQRPFQTHLTIGRVRGGGPAVAELGKLIEQQADFLAGRMTVDRVTVFSSTLTPNGPIYTVLSTSPLAPQQ